MNLESYAGLSFQERARMATMALENASAGENVRSVFDDECSHLVLDAKFVKRLSEYRIGFTTKNDDHIAFFGGNLLGVHVVRFMPADRDAWFDNILEANDAVLEERLHALPDIDPMYKKIASDVMNLSCAWLMNALYRSTRLTDRQKHDAMIDVALVMQYKFLTSMMYHFFPYPADPITAAATYSQLSYKFAIKVHGTWNKVLEARAEEIIARHSIHYKTVTEMNSDIGVIYLINDSYGRLKDMVKNIVSVFMIVHKQGANLTTTSSSAIDHDGEAILRDRTKSQLAYNRYLHSIITDKASFIRTELVSVIENLMHTMPPRMLLESLTYMSNNYQRPGASEIEEVVTETIIHAFDYIAANRSVIRNTNDLPTILSKLRGSYMSSRSSDTVLMNLRDKTEKIVRAATGSRHPAMVSATRTGILLYLVARGFTMKHYSSKLHGVKR